jgi:hypothetical protein
MVSAASWSRERSEYERQTFYSLLTFFSIAAIDGMKYGTRR